MHRFTQVDVFTPELLQGNALAVVHDADDLSDEQMAAFARWTNLSETTFLLTPTAPEADYRVRIFTPGGELPFAGHPTLGSAQAWLEAGGSPRDAARIVQECGLGLVPVRPDANRLAFAAPPLIRSGPVDPAELSRVVASLGLTDADVVDSQWVDNGPGWMGILLRDADVVLGLEPDFAALRPVNLGVIGPAKVGVVGPASEEADFEVRAFVPSLGVAEDPVTGSLNAGLAQWLIATGRAPASYVARQGTRVQRNGLVHIDQIGDDIWVGGDTVVGVRGEVAL